MSAVETESKLNTAPDEKKTASAADDVEFIKILVHNVSHADLCVVIQPSSVVGISQQRELMARPRSSRFKSVCDEINQAIKKGAAYSGATYKDAHNRAVFVGYLFNPPLRICAWSDFRIRDSTQSTVKQSLSCVVVRVFFPLLSVILPKWLILHHVPRYDSPYASPYTSPMYRPVAPSAQDEIEFYSTDDDDDANNGDDVGGGDGNDNERCLLDLPITMTKTATSGSQTHDHDCQFRLFLVSGTGHALKKQSAYHQEDSTLPLSHLLCQFIANFYPQIVVTQFCSDKDIFHYVENTKFVHSKLRPAIDEQRAFLAAKHGKHWKRFFGLSMSLGDGTPARLSAIIEGLRTFEPDMLHMFRRKTLWIEYPNIRQLWESDLEHLRFDQLETYPAIPVTEITDDMILGMVCEMKQWRDAFLSNAVENAHSEMASFWLRKTLQPVLAILCVQKPKQSALYYRGVNVEVSMPTGSLCAERNAIGTALAADPSLRREHIKAVAVLFMGEFATATVERKLHASATKQLTLIEDAQDDNPRGPCGSCVEWLKKIADCNPTFKVITFRSRKLEQVFVRNLK
eukprot:CAMPEP_0202696172 /NCGR_PEP_ID=MMETSP1385-20130828/9497_1 /ASSEMBLY_ACC=CAM_ASM_000861 /TAXON_ID=933848 /ORGANISM="Elphidium margaritaceum" /LENGTH=570 /DNA_ID=CAMNT_0049352285 /DNA_START=29 /DNA_END=1741 /DNA_ORIENTATION=-